MKASSLETTDIFRGAFFMSRGAELGGVRFQSDGKPRLRRGRRIASFLFTGRGLDKLDKQYRDGQALVNPLQFRESLNHLRDILFEKLREQDDPSSHKCYDATRGRMRNDDRKRNHRGYQTRR